MLTEGWNWGKDRCRGADGEVQRRRSGLHAGGVGVAVLRSSGLHESTRGVPARESRRSGRPGMLRRCRIVSAESLTGGGGSALGKAAALGFAAVFGVG